MMENNVKRFDGDRFKTGYIDESGDSGKEGSKCLVLTCVCLDETKKASRIIKKAKEQLRRIKSGERWLNRLGGEIKFYGFPDKIILLKTIEELAKLKFPIQFVVIYKDGNNINPPVKVQILCDLIGQIFKLDEMPYKIIADKDYFDNRKIAYLVVQDYEELNSEEGVKGYKCKIYLADENVIKKSDNVNMLISIKHENSKNNLGLQVADLISRAIFKEAENNNKEYTDVIRKYNNIKGRIIKLKE